MEQNTMRDEIIQEIDSRIERLKEHRFDQIVVTGNQYEELNQAIKKVINVPLMCELEDLKEFIQELS